MKNMLDALRYLWEILWQIPGNWTKKKKILSQVVVCVRDYATDPRCEGYDSFVTRFGTTKQIAEACVDGMDTEELLGSMRIQRKIVRILSVMASVIIAIWLSFVMVTCIKVMDESPGYIEVSVEVIDRTDVMKGND